MIMTICLHQGCDFRSCQRFSVQKRHVRYQTFEISGVFKRGPGNVGIFSVPPCWYPSVGPPPCRRIASSAACAPLLHPVDVNVHFSCLALDCATNVHKSSELEGVSDTKIFSRLAVADVPYQCAVNVVIAKRDAVRAVVFRNSYNLGMLFKGSPFSRDAYRDCSPADDDPAIN